MLEFECPHCRARSPYVAELIGRQIFCLGCGTHILVPNLAAKESPVPGTEPYKPIVIKVPPSIIQRGTTKSGEGPIASTE